jgi:tetratricopeptide (TPR) repeat protein
VTRRLTAALWLAALLVLPPGFARAERTIEAALEQVDPRLREAMEALAYGRFAEAERAAAAVLAGGALETEPAVEYEAHRIRISAATGLRDAEAVVAHMRAAADAAGRAGEPAGERRMLVEAAVVEATVLDREIEARRTFETLLAGGDAFARAEIHWLMAFSLERLDDPGEASHQLRLALAELEELPEETTRSLRASVDLSLGRLLLAEGEIQRAMPLLLEARSLGEALDDDMDGNVELELGRAYALQHDLDRAEEAFLAALGQTIDQGKVGTALLELGRVARDRGDTAGAQRFFDKAAKIARRNELMPLLVQTTLESARFMFEIDAADTAILALETMQSLGEEGGVLDAASSAGVDRDVAAALCEAGEYGRATELFVRAQDKAADAPHSLQSLLVAQAACEREQGRLDSATDALLAAAAILEEQRGQVAGGLEDRRRFFAASADVGAQLVDVLVEAGHTERALLAAESLKSRTLLDILTVGGAASVAALPTDLADRDAELVSRIATLQREALRDPSFDATRRAELDGLRDEQADLRQQGAARIPGGAPLRSLTGGGSTAELQAALAPDEVALVYCLTGTELLLFAVRDDELAVHRLGEPNGIRRNVRRVRRYLRQPDPGFVRGLAIETAPPGDDATAGRVFGWLAGELHHQLWAPAAPQLEGAARVIIVPDGFLHYLPFEILVDGEGGYVAEQVVTSYAPSLTALQLLRAAPAPAARPATLFAVADPAFETEGREGSGETAAALRNQRGVHLAPLPGTRDEVDNIRQTMTEAQVLTGRDATERAVTTALDSGRHRYIHLATHGLVPDDLSWLSQPALVLSLADLDAEDDGLLDLGEIADLSLEADVVVLSACQTAIGDEVRGEGLIGLTRAFMTAGSPRVVASLWSVPDDATAELMTEFYRQLQQQDAADALATARRATMANHPHPYHWAGFVITGR